MKKILSLILLSLMLPASGAENLSKVFSNELAQSKSLDNNVTLINSMETISSPQHNTSRLHSVALQRMLDSKEFKEFAKDKKVTVINIYRTLTYKDVTRLNKEARKNALNILGENAPHKASHWRDIMSNSAPNSAWHKMSRKEQDAWVAKKMDKPLPTHYTQQAMTSLMVKERGKRQLLWKAFNGQAPVSLLLDNEGNVLNKKLYRWSPESEEQYTNELLEILDPEEAKEKAEKKAEEDKKKDKKKEPVNKRPPTSVGK